MAQGRSTKIISMLKWIRTSSLSIKKGAPVGEGHVRREGEVDLRRHADLRGGVR